MADREMYVQLGSLVFIWPEKGETVQIVHLEEADEIPAFGEQPGMMIDAPSIEQEPEEFKKWCFDFLGLSLIEDLADAVARLLLSNPKDVDLDKARRFGARKALGRYARIREPSPFVRKALEE